jgi:hypothetical protein
MLRLNTESALSALCSPKLDGHATRIKDSYQRGLTLCLYEKHGLTLTNLKIDPYFIRLKSDPRYTELLHKVGLPE